MENTRHSVETQDINKSTFNRRDMLKAGSLALGGLALGGLLTPANAASKPFKLPSRSNPLLLNFNESAYGYSSLVTRNLTKEFDNLSRYPIKAEEELKVAVAKFYGIKDDRVNITNGSSAALQSSIYAVNAFAQEQNVSLRVIVADPTFEFVESYAKPLGAEIIKVPVDSKFNINTDRMKTLEREFDGVSLVYICNPNNPTGNIINPNELYSWIKSAKSTTIFLIDEAYAEYITSTSFKSAIDTLREGVKNVIVARTFSKVYGLAALRIGYTISSPEWQKRIADFVELVGINLLGARAAAISLSDFAFRQYVVNTNNKSRQILTKALDSLELKYSPSYGNFVFHEITGDFDDFSKNMQNQNILVGRKFDKFDNFCRVTLGTPDEMQHYVKVLRNFRAKRLI
ncbi:aminotransferase class I/II-fold pyridoxal phosphate-dependent enzyme [Helicobacter saguini]|uniref:Aminotransferase class I/II-fold pyridoxal phosphate-dependent enzyme n=1 Tax=Helicobacter saguini TaxID=1548018 RepID=A0A347VQU7_9HELI|nr:histidinol-phosphate transaminase [Helicobacter saguini]MWV63152.1 aminotransferase class I/II-fold pyridoxal phosphate-dependent enzyme [Helicobacter saguini]MWV66178.1 aminotransferase class I/II-fold pyridoxal phosphate-dependent enzyme [Helicobacter saguini]MWV68527.1 aminotransferase class I/II-fold pyridoxal phosphate-dependent enzyme [Helicobacter saguini]MWV71918.1 aminotransferase class I/II-fold pyridoxal phosphate-dependent enzyme [Helicobacter saguini]TLD95931.1 histidinol-phosp